MFEECFDGVTKEICLREKFAFGDRSKLKLSQSAFNNYVNVIKIFHKSKIIQSKEREDSD